MPAKVNFTGLTGRPYEPAFGSFEWPFTVGEEHFAIRGTQDGESWHVVAYQSDPGSGKSVHLYGVFLVPGEAVDLRIVRKAALARWVDLRPDFALTVLAQALADIDAALEVLR